jgi:hypothetical protein
MAAHASCDRCPTVVEKVLCPDHAELKCDSCERVSDRMLCEDCADGEYGDDGDRRAPDDDDIVELLERSVVSDDLQDLAAAIRRRDLVESEYLLDKVASAVPGWSDRVSLGRYSPRAKAA